MIRQLVALIMMACLPGIQAKAVAQWLQSAGPAGGNVTALVASNGYLLAGTNGGGIYRSGDDGQHWAAANTGLNSMWIRAMVASDGILFAGTDAGVCRSTDDGGTWTDESADLTGDGPPPLVNSFAVNGSIVYTGTDLGGLYLSSNGGINWNLVADTVFQGEGIMALVARDTVLVAVTEDPSVFLSSDNGATWTQTATFDWPFNALGVHGTNLFLSNSDSGVWRSSDDGSTWSLLDSGATLGPVVRSFAANGDTLFAGTTSGVYLSTDDGLTWAPVGTISLHSTVSTILVSNAAVIAGTTSEGIYRSTDGGLNWISINTGFLNTRVRCFAVKNQTLFAGSSLGVIRSTDDGNSWTVANGGIPKKNVRCFLLYDTILYAGTDGDGVFLTTDNGASWQPTGSVGLTSLRIVALAAESSVIFAGTVTGEHIYRSTDGGSTWIATNLKSSTVAALTSIAVDGGYLFAGTFAGSNGGVFRSSDYGVTWEAVNNGITDYYIAALLVDDTILYAGTAFGNVFRSTDYGANWTASGSPPAGAISQFAASGSYLFAGTTNAGIYRSNKNLDGWIDINEGLPTSNVQALTLSGSMLIAGTGQFAVWRRSLGELLPTLDAGVDGGWNMLSVPVLTGNYDPRVIFPRAVSNAFSYQGSYIPEEELQNGSGYWVKFALNSRVSFFGSIITAETVAVASRWNMIGSISSSLPVSTIASDPPGMIVSNFFTYQSDTGNYIIADSIVPGRAYWVKSAQGGNLILGVAPHVSAANHVIIVPTSEFPPPVPSGSLDEPRSVPTVYRLEQNYPNPFNPSTQIEFSVPRPEYVTLKIFDMLGREIRTLVSEHLQAGSHHAEWNPASTGSGVYFYRLQAGSFSETRKLLLLK
ncbi:MAG TPA: T9SS type A sorting domain-containing protein [Bacteroidota bacterium]|nr:T9SS type A sorting domain-containing protein [Bacteroidota bacterium]